jgi:calcineurin-like phosphoesterase family protein
MLQKLKIVRGHDTLIHVGDFGFGNRDVLMSYFNQIRGHKILIRGNHDDKNRAHKLPWDHYCRQFTMAYRDAKIHFQHRPYDKYSLPAGANIVIHGHTHNIGQRYEMYNGVLIVNASVEQWDYRPFALQEVYDEFKRRVQ